MLAVNNLSGFGAGSSGASGLSLIASDSNTNSATIDIPVAGRAAGNLCVLVQYSYNADSEPSYANPTGFTASAHATGSDSRGYITWKILDGTETTLTGLDATTDYKHIYVFGSGWTTGTPLSINVINVNSNPAADTVTASGGTVPLVVIAAAFGKTGASFSTFSPTYDGIISSTDGESAYKIYAAGDTPVNHTIDMGDVGTDNYLANLYIELS